MTNAKKILIETESHEVFIVRMNVKSKVRGFCPECKTEVVMLTIDEAVSVSNLSTIAILNQLRAGAIHSLETASGHLLICERSLTALNQRE